MTRTATLHLVRLAGCCFPSFLWFFDLLPFSWRTRVCERSIHGKLWRDGQLWDVSFYGRQNNLKMTAPVNNKSSSLNGTESVCTKMGHFSNFRLAKIRFHILTVIHFQLILPSLKNLQTAKSRSKILFPRQSHATLRDRIDPPPSQRVSHPAWSPWVSNYFKNKCSGNEKISSTINCANNPNSGNFEFRSNFSVLKWKKRSQHVLDGI